MRIVTSVLILTILIISACSDEDEIGFPPSAYQLSRIYKDRFYLDIPNAPVVYNAFLDQYVSTVYYEDDYLYRVYINKNREVTVNRTNPVFPAGEQKVLCIIRMSEYLKANSDLVIELWEKAQSDVNLLHVNYAAGIGLEEPIVKFTNVNLYTNFEDFPVTGSSTLKSDMKIFAKSRGIDPEFTIFLFMDLDTDAPSGGWGDYRSGLAKVGWIYDNSLALDDENFRGLAYAAYHHEIGHVWGWEHDWSDPYLTENFIADPALFGWTDEDGDGVVEILDPTPYGGD